MFRSLKHRSFRIFFTGQFISLCGSWAQGTALSWLMYRLTGDPMMLGLVNFVSQFPVFLLGFYAGHVVERLDRRRLVIAMQSVAMFQAATMAALTLAGVVAVWHVFALAFLLSLVYAFDIPARQVLIGEMVPAKDRHNAIALNSTLVNGARIIGPAAAGAAIGWAGEGWVFAANAASYLAVISGLLMIDLRPRARKAAGSAASEIKAGIAFAAGHPALLVTLLLLLAFSVAGLPVYVLMPVFAADLQVGARGLGLFSSSAGLGAMLGALFLANREHSRGLARVIPAAMAVYALALLGVAASGQFSLTLALFGVVGFCAILVLAGVNTLLQELAGDAFRGRVMSFYSMIFIGLSPIGSFAVGAAASRLGVRPTVAWEGALLLAAAAACLRRYPALVAAESSRPPEPHAEPV